jgi:hypothetical protein
MGSILKFIAIVFLILLILAFALPLLWVVIKEIGLLFGGLFMGIGGSPVFRTILSLKNYNIVNQINNYQKRVVLGHLAPFFV